MWPISSLLKKLFPQFKHFNNRMKPKVHRNTASDARFLEHSVDYCDFEADNPGSGRNDVGQSATHHQHTVNTFVVFVYSGTNKQVTVSGMNKKVNDHKNCNVLQVKAQSHIFAWILPDLFHIFVYMWNVDHNSRHWKKDTGIGDEMFPQTPRYLVQRSHNQWGSESQNWKRHWAIWRPLDYSEKTQTEVVRARHTIIWTGQDYPTGNSSRRKMKRQTEETMGRQHQRVDWPSMEHHTTESWEQRGVEEAGCKIYRGAPTVMFVCWLVAYRPSNMQMYLRDRSAQTILRAATLR